MDDKSSVPPPVRRPPEAPPPPAGRPVRLLPLPPVEVRQLTLEDIEGSLRRVLWGDGDTMRADLRQARQERDEARAEVEQYREATRAWQRTVERLTEGLEERGIPPVVGRLPIVDPIGAALAELDRLRSARDGDLSLIVALERVLDELHGEVAMAVSWLPTDSRVADRLRSALDRHRHPADPAQSSSVSSPPAERVVPDEQGRIRIPIQVDGQPVDVELQVADRLRRWRVTLTEPHQGRATSADLLWLPAHDEVIHEQLAAVRDFGASSADVEAAAARMREQFGITDAAANLTPAPSTYEALARLERQGAQVTWPQRSERPPADSPQQTDKETGQ